MTVRDRAKSRLREAFAIGAAVGGVALGVGAAVAATSPALVSPPPSAEAPAGGTESLSPAPPRVLGYSILRPSSLTVETPSGLEILAGTGMRITGLPSFARAWREPVESKAAGTPARPARKHAPGPAPAPAPPATAPPAMPVAEPDFPGQGEEHRSESAAPKRSERAVEQAERLDDDDDAKRKGDD